MMKNINKIKYRVNTLELPEYYSKKSVLSSVIVDKNLITKCCAKKAVTSILEFEIASIAILAKT